MSIAVCCVFNPVLSIEDLAVRCSRVIISVCLVSLAFEGCVDMRVLRVTIKHGQCSPMAAQCPSRWTIGPSSIPNGYVFLRAS